MSIAIIIIDFLSNMQRISTTAIACVSKHSEYQHEGDRLHAVSYCHHHQTSTTTSASSQHITAKESPCLLASTKTKLLPLPILQALSTTATTKHSTTLHGSSSSALRLANSHNSKTAVIIVDVSQRRATSRSRRSNII